MVLCKALLQEVEKRRGATEDQKQGQQRGCSLKGAVRFLQESWQNTSDSTEGDFMHSKIKNHLFGPAFLEKNMQGSLRVARYSVKEVKNL